MFTFRATAEAGALVELPAFISHLMGIDIYARWNGQTEDEEDQTYRYPFSIASGHAGYLREAYHGAPYATRYLFAEAFETGRARIPAAVLRGRLPHTLTLAAEREERLYGSDDVVAVLQSYQDFVALCEQKERQTGEPVTIIASY